jgi:hypothetical protein
MNYDDMEDPEAGEGPVLDDVEDKPDNVSAGLDLLRVLQNQLSSSEKSNHLAAWSQLQRPDALTAIALATRAPILIAPAMNGKMWLHPATQQNAETLRTRGCRFIGPDEGMLACGYEGVGRLAEVETILQAVKSLLSTKK